MPQSPRTATSTSATATATRRSIASAPTASRSSRGARRARARASSTQSTACSSTTMTATACTPPIASTTGSSSSPGRRVPRRVGRPAPAAERSKGSRRRVLRRRAVTSRHRARPGWHVLARWGDGVDTDEPRSAASRWHCPGRHRAIRWSGAACSTTRAPGLFCAPHGIAVDSAGSLYVAESSESWIGLDRGSRSVQKFVRV